MTNNPKHAFNSATKTYDEENLQQLQKQNRKRVQNTHLYFFIQTTDRQTDGITIGILIRVGQHTTKTTTVSTTTEEINSNKIQFEQQAT